MTHNSPRRVQWGWVACVGSLAWVGCSSDQKDALDTGTGGSSSTGGAPHHSGGHAGAGGDSSEETTGGASDSGGAAAGGGGTLGSGGEVGACDAGRSTTSWAQDCSAEAPSCTAGTWIADGPDPDHQGFALCAESEHFAVYSDQACTESAQGAVNHLETVWDLYFGRPMYMREPLCEESSKFKSAIHVHSDWGLSGGAWDDKHMGMWIGQAGLTDHWGLAHEFMHGVQSLEGGQRCNQSNTCGWIYESHANWAAQQQPEYHQTDVHCSEMLVNAPHLYLGSTRDRYCNWQFMEFLKDKHCFSAVNAIWTGQPSADPFTAIRNGLGWSLDELNDFFGDWAMHNVTWDYQDPEPQETAGSNQGELFRSKYGITTDTSTSVRRLRTTKLLPQTSDLSQNRRFFSPDYWAPQRYGYSVVRLFADANASEVTVDFRGVLSAENHSDFRWGLVATDKDLTQARYSALASGTDGSITFCTQDAEELFLVVTATPSQWYDIVWDQPYSTVPRYPYMVELHGAWPEGFAQGAQDDCPDGLVRAQNGGGCAPEGTTAYVGPYARVSTGATVSGEARIEDHAAIENGTVSGGSVGALSTVGVKAAPGVGASAFKISAGTARTTFYPLGFFESGQGLSGGTLMGDVEYRGTNLSRASGTCAGFVDEATCVDPGDEATPAPPYTWR